MILKPPDGSKISVTTEGTDPMIVVPSGSAGAMRYFVGLFLLFWLGGWFVGFSDVLTRVLTGKANTFLFSGWAAGRWRESRSCFVSTESSAHPFRSRCG